MICFDLFFGTDQRFVNFREVLLSRDPFRAQNATVKNEPAKQ